VCVLGHVDTPPARGATPQAVTGVAVELSGALGRRTKHQSFDAPQLVLRAASAPGGWDAVPASAPAAAAAGDGAAAAPPPAVGVRTIALAEADADTPLLEATAFVAAGGEGTRCDAYAAHDGAGAVRGVLGADPSDAHRMLPEATDAVTAAAVAAAAAAPPSPAPAAAVVDGALSALDQCVVLALCLDVKNSNPAVRAAWRGVAVFVCVLLRAHVS
jgi:hypothetical protein